MSDLTSLMNIGREMARKLTAVGISSAGELAALGAAGAFARLKAAYPRVCLVHLYALEGALTRTEYHALPEARKRELKAFSDSLRPSSQNHVPSGDAEEALP